jgi:hypothetical protein
MGRFWTFGTRFDAIDEAEEVGYNEACFYLPLPKWWQ